MRELKRRCEFRSGGYDRRMTNSGGGRDPVRTDTDQQWGVLRLEIYDAYDSVDRWITARTRQATAKQTTKPAKASP